MSMVRSRRATLAKTIGNIVAIVVVVWLSAVVIFPIAWLMLTSFKTPIDIASPTPTFIFEPTLDNYRAVFAGRSGVFRAMFNSIVISVVSTLISVALAAMAAYGLARLRPPGHGALGLTIFGMRMLPPAALVIPIFFIAFWTSTLDTQLALIIPYVALAIPLGTWMLQGFFLDLPKELEEAAVLCGATWWQAFTKVILPLAGPGLAAVAIFSFSLSWNDLLLALPLTTEDAITLPVVASRVRTDEGILWGNLGAVTTIIMLPMLLFTLVSQRWLIQGLSAGATKG